MARSRPNRCQHALQRPPESHRIWPFIPIFIPIHKRTIQVQVHPFFRPNMDDASPSPSWITHHARASTRCACIPRCGIPGDAIPSTVPTHAFQVRRSVHGVQNARVFEARAASRGQSRSTSFSIAWSRVAHPRVRLSLAVAHVHRNRTSSGSTWSFSFAIFVARSAKMRDRGSIREKERKMRKHERKPSRLTSIVNTRRSRRWVRRKRDNAEGVLRTWREKTGKGGCVGEGGEHVRACMHDCMLVREKEMEGMLVSATKKFL